jgi:hypothetical protein
MLVVHGRIELLHLVQIHVDLDSVFCYFLADWDFVLCLLLLILKLLFAIIIDAGAWVGSAPRLEFVGPCIFFEVVRLKYDIVNKLAAFIVRGAVMVYQIWGMFLIALWWCWLV